MIGDEPWEIVLENVRVPVSHRVGEEGDGFATPSNGSAPAG